MSYPAPVQQDPSYSPNSGPPGTIISLSGYGTSDGPFVMTYDSDYFSSTDSGPWYGGDVVIGDNHVIGYTAYNADYSIGYYGSTPFSWTNTGPSGFKWYHNPVDNTYMYTNVDPGSPWVLQDPPIDVHVDSVFAPGGGTVGGAYVAIEGKGFVDLGPVLSVTFGGLPATDVSVLSDTIIDCRTPAHPAGMVTVSVIFDGYGTLSSSTPIYTYESFTWTLENPAVPVHGGTLPPSPTEGSSVVITSPGPPTGIDPTHISNDIGGGVSDVNLFYVDVDNHIRIVNIPTTNIITRTTTSFTFIIPPFLTASYLYSNKLPLKTEVPIIISVIGDGTQFSGSVNLGSLNLYVEEASGIYILTAGKTNDTLYTGDGNTTQDVEIPDPYIKTAFLP